MIVFVIFVSLFILSVWLSFSYLRPYINDVVKSKNDFL